MNDSPIQNTSTCLHPSLLQLQRGGHLSQRDSGELLDVLLSDGISDTEIRSVLDALGTKDETVDELAGMASALRARAVHINSHHEVLIDTAGTGSSSVKTFNVSTSAAFVIAGAGLPVAKHGNRAATSQCGSADVLKALGVNIAAIPEVSETCLNEIGICFMFAPLYNGATARIARIRRELGVRTIFNLLGPLSNPAGAMHQIIGVWNGALIETVAGALVSLGTERSWVVHGLDGLDEVTIADETIVAEVYRGEIRSFRLAPEDFELARARIDHLCGGDAKSNARIIRSVLDGDRRDEARSLMVANAAAALMIAGFCGNLSEAARQAERSIDSGAALTKLNDLARMTNQ